MKQVIAKVKLNPGNGGFFDPITRVHLTHGNPIGNVYAGMNVTGLQAAVRSRRISVIEGSLGKFNAPFKLVKTNDGKIVLTANKPEESSEQKVEPKKNVKVEEPKKEELKVEEPKTEESIVEEIPVIEEPEAKEEPVEQAIEEPVTEETAEEVQEEIETPVETEEKVEEPKRSRRKKKSK